MRPRAASPVRWPCPRGQPFGCANPPAVRTLHLSCGDNAPPRKTRKWPSNPWFGNLHFAGWFVILQITACGCGSDPADRRHWQRRQCLLRPLSRQRRLCRCRRSATSAAAVAPMAPAPSAEPAAPARRGRLLREQRQGAGSTKRNTPKRPLPWQRQGRAGPPRGTPPLQVCSIYQLLAAETEHLLVSVDALRFLLGGLDLLYKQSVVNACPAATRKPFETNVACDSASPTTPRAGTARADAESAGVRH